jgi:hypothetical protein
MKTAMSVLWTISAVAIGMTLVQAGMAQPTPPVPVAPAAPSPQPSPTPPSSMDPTVEQWQKQVELETERAVHEAAAAQEAAIAAVKATGMHLPIKIDLNFGHSDGPSAKIREAAKRVSEAPDETAKAAATAELMKLLDEYFAADMREREQQLADIQARVQRLQAQLDHRRAKKQEILDLQAKVAINEAEGLGFYGDSKPGGFDFATPTGRQFMGTMPMGTMSNGQTWVSEPSSTSAPATSATPAPASSVVPQ